MEFIREINHYEVRLEHFVSASGRYEQYSVKTFYNLEDAIKFARENQEQFKITVKQVCNIVGWWE